MLYVFGAATVQDAEQASVVIVLLNETKASEDTRKSLCLVKIRAALLKVRAGHFYGVDHLILGNSHFKGP